jgi:enoyl-CoA hydratase/carnithine racemase
VEYQHIRFEVEEQVATLTLHRPEHLNAFTGRMGIEWGDALARCDADDGVRAVVITGAGRAFCAGADLARGKDAFGEPRAELPRPERRPLQPWQVRKPVVAAINGHAIGVGLTLPMQCDVRFVAEDAKLAFAFVRRGVIPELASHVIVSRVAGLSCAAELLLSGRTFSGREAAELGLASRALPAGEVLPAALAWAREIALHAAPASVAISKRLLWEGVADSVPQMLAKEEALFDWVRRQPDAIEGVVSFVEKRPASWKLRPSADLPDWPAPGASPAQRGSR